MKKGTIVEVKSTLINDWDLPWFFYNVVTEYLELSEQIKDKENLIVSIQNIIDKMIAIYETRPRDFTSYYDKGKPITNYVKGILNQACSELNLPKLDNNKMSKLLNKVREWYSVDGKLGVVLREPSFFESEKYLSHDWGDANSCFREKGCNRGHYHWIKNHSDFFRLVLFLFKDKNKDISRGRCWALCVPDVDNPEFILLTNFYSYGFNIMDKCWRLPIAKAIEKIYGWENAVVSMKLASSIYIPFYRNSYSFLVYKKGLSEGEIIDLYNRYCYGECSGCGGDFHFRDLNHDNCSHILCENCLSEDHVYCARCGERIHRDYVYYSEITGEYYCEYCYSDLFTSCKNCDCELLINDDDTIYLSDVGEYICRHCFERGNYGVCEECNAHLHMDNLQVVYKIGLSNYFASEFYLCNLCIDDFMRSGQCIEIEGIKIMLTCYKDLRKLQEMVEDIIEKRNIYVWDIDDILPILKECIPKFFKKYYPEIFDIYWENKNIEEVNVYENR